MRNHPRHLALAVLLSFSSTLVPHSAFAQAVGGDPTLQAARARFAEGVDFYDKGEFEKARASFLQAYALHKHPAVLLNLAQSSLRSGHPLDADKYFTSYMHDSPSLTAGQRAEAEKGLLEARAKLGRIEVAAASPGTAVTVDGDVVTTEGATVTDVEPGTHVVKAGAETNSVTVVAGQTVTVKFGKSDVPSGAGTPDVPSGEGAAAPATGASSSTGLFSRPDTLAPVWIGLGVGVAGLTTAILFAVFKGGAQSSYNNQYNAIGAASPGGNPGGACISPASPQVQTACSAASSDANAVNTDATIANVGIAVGAVGVAFAAGWYLFAPKQRAAAPADAAPKTAWPEVHPLVGPHLGGLGLGGTF